MIFQKIAHITKLSSIGAVELDSHCVFACHNWFLIEIKEIEVFPGQQTLHREFRRRRTRSALQRACTVVDDLVLQLYLNVYDLIF